MNINSENLKTKITGEKRQFSSNSSEEPQGKIQKTEKNDKQRASKLETNPEKKESPPYLNPVADLAKLCHLEDMCAAALVVGKNAYITCNSNSNTGARKGLSDSFTSRKDFIDSISKHLKNIKIKKDNNTEIPEKERDEIKKTRINIARISALYKSKVNTGGKAFSESNLPDKHENEIIEGLLNLDKNNNKYSTENSFNNPQATIDIDTFHRNARRSTNSLKRIESNILRGNLNLDKVEFLQIGSTDKKTSEHAEMRAAGYLFNIGFFTNKKYDGQTAFLETSVKCCKDCHDFLQAISDVIAERKKNNPDNHGGTLVFNPDRHTTNIGDKWNIPKNFNVLKINIFGDNISLKEKEEFSNKVIKRYNELKSETEMEMKDAKKNHQNIPPDSPDYEKDLEEFSKKIQGIVQNETVDEYLRSLETPYIVTSQKKTFKAQPYSASEASNKSTNKNASREKVSLTTKQPIKYRETIEAPFNIKEIKTKLENLEKNKNMGDFIKEGLGEDATYTLRNYENYQKGSNGDFWYVDEKEGKEYRIILHNKEILFLIQGEKFNYDEENNTLFRYKHPEKESQIFNDDSDDEISNISDDENFIVSSNDDKENYNIDKCKYDKNYLLRSHDINFAASYLLKTKSNIYLLPAQQNHTQEESSGLKKALLVAKEQLDEGKEVVSAYNKNGNHWVAYKIAKLNDEIVVLYKDSYGEDCPDSFKEDFRFAFPDKKINFNFSDKTEQKDAVSCGIFAVKNMEILSNSSIENFEKISFYKPMNDHSLSDERLKFAQYYREEVKQEENIKNVIKENLDKLDKELVDPIKMGLRSFFIDKNIKMQPIIAESRTVSDSEIQVCFEVKDSGSLQAIENTLKAQNLQYSSKKLSDEKQGIFISIEEANKLLEKLNKNEMLVPSLIADFDEKSDEALDRQEDSQTKTHNDNLERKKSVANETVSHEFPLDDSFLDFVKTLHLLGIKPTIDSPEVNKMVVTIEKHENDLLFHNNDTPEAINTSSATKNTDKKNALSSDSNHPPMTTSPYFKQPPASSSDNSRNTLPNSRFIIGNQQQSNKERISEFQNFKKEWQTQFLSEEKQDPSATTIKRPGDQQ